MRAGGEAPGQRRSAPRIRVDRDQPVAVGRAFHRDDARADAPPAALPELPVRLAVFGARAGDAPRFAAAHAIKIPEVAVLVIAAVADKKQPALVKEADLADRMFGAVKQRAPPAQLQHAVARMQFGRGQPALVPRHVRVVPFHPGDFALLRRGRRARVKTGAFGQNLRLRIAARVCMQRDQRVAPAALHHRDHRVKFFQRD